MSIKCFSPELSVFHGRTVPKEGVIVGYGAIIESFDLSAPIPNQLSFVSEKKRSYQTEQWRVFESRYLPEQTLYKQLIFAFKYEGVDLIILKKLFDQLNETEVSEMIQQEIMGQYSRRIWFLYEWLLDKKLDIPDLKKGNLVSVINEKLQYAILGKSSRRHKVINNLPGTKNFCPLIKKTEKLESYIQSDIQNQRNIYLNRVSNSLLQRASAYLLLKDSKASFTIEGEKPRNNRAARWGKAIGQAGSTSLDINELNRLQQIVIENSRFTKMGIRKQQGFVGGYDELSHEPIPDHISARFEDLPQLMEGWISTKNLLIEKEMDAVLVAAKIAFGFVFIHPFVDGNGRLHRYIIHHILAAMDYTQQGVIFPVSASILDHIRDYTNVLEDYSHPVLENIEWNPAPDNNVKINNDTIDLYRYFDCTKQAEFLYDCVQDTIQNIIPDEISYLEKYDEFKRYIDDVYEMPDKELFLLVSFLRQGEGKLSKRALKKEFSLLAKTEIIDIENKFKEIFEIEE